MERTDLFTGRTDYGKRETFDAADGLHVSTVGTDIEHEVFLHGTASEVDLLAQGLRVLRTHAILNGELAGTKVETDRIDKLVEQISEAQATRRREFIAQHQKSWILEQRTE